MHLQFVVCAGAQPVHSFLVVAEVDASLQSGYGLLTSGVVLAFLAQMIVVSLAKQTLKQDESSESEEHIRCK